MAADDRDREGSRIRNSVWKWEWGGGGGCILHACILPACRPGNMAADDRDREGSRIRNSVWKWEWGRGEEGVGAGGYSACRPGNKAADVRGPAVHGSVVQSHRLVALCRCRTELTLTAHVSQYCAHQASRRCHL